jgi:hypothetical protein
MHHEQRKSSWCQWQWTCESYYVSARGPYFDVTSVSKWGR